MLAGRGEQDLVEDGHADDDAGLDLGGDDGLGRVDDLAAELDAAVDRARVHEHLAGPSRRPLIWYQVAYSRSDGTQLSVMRSFCIRSA